MVVGYAAFSSVLNIKGTTGISSNWDIKITQITEETKTGEAVTTTDESGNKKISGVGTLTATVEADLFSPGDSIEYDIVITNQGTINAKLDKITKTESNNPVIKFETSGLTEGDTLNAGSTATLKLKITYDSNVTSQPENLEGSMTITLDYVQADETSEVPGGNVGNETAADKLIATEVTSGEGLYSDEYELGRYTYKGADPNNYITFNDELWRIIAVESDGTLKIIRPNSIEKLAWDSTSSNNWARPATLNTYLNSDYYNTLSENSKSVIQEHTWAVGTITDYSNLSNQIAGEKAAQWTGKVGLISASDFVRANYDIERCGVSLSASNSSSCLPTNYIYLFVQNNSSDLWIINPYDGSPSLGNSIQNGIGVTSSWVGYNGTIDVLPALYLTSDIHLDGEGTSTNPYRIVSE